MTRTAARSTLRPLEEAVILGDHMLAAADINQAILEETLDSAMDGQILESGRTACGNAGNTIGPSLRMPTAVELAACPVGGVEGVWHTHVTRSQFENPEHSLPDIANVIFEGIDTSIVTGVRTSQVFYAPDDLAAGETVFRDVLGLEVNSTAEVKQSIVDGRIPEPADARSRMFSAFGPLVVRRSTPLLDASSIAQNLDVIPRTMAGPDGGDIAYELYECAMDELFAGAGVSGVVASQAATDRTTEYLRQTWDDLADVSRYIASRGLDDALGIVIGTLIARRFINGK